MFSTERLVLKVNPTAFSFLSLDTNAIDTKSYNWDIGDDTPTQSLARTYIMENQPKPYGFTQMAETANGRLAMLGFVIGVATEWLTGQGILSQIGLM